MKLLHIVDKMDPKTGGVCQAIRMIVHALSEYQVESEVVSLDSPDSDFEKTDPFKIYPLGPAENPWQYAKTLGPWLTSNISRYDMVIIHGLWQYYGFAAYKACKAVENRPMVYVMPHGMLDPYFQNAPERKLKAVRNVIYWKLIEKRVINSADGVLFTCKTEQELARLPFKPYAPKFEAVVGLGITAPPSCKPEMIQAFYKKTGMEPGSEFILFLSRIHIKKGLDLLIEAYIMLAYTIDMPKLVIAGPGMDSDFGRRINVIIDAHPKLRSQFIFPGMLTGDAKWGAFYACQAFVLPSHQENFGIAVVEALSCGKPVLISDQVNIYKEILAADAGLVEPDTLEGASDLLQSWLILSKSEKNLMAANAKRCYEELFNTKAVANRIVQLKNLNHEKQYGYQFSIKS